MTDLLSPRRSRTRARILDRAEALFHERGLRKVTVEDLCAAAGVSRRTFYQHFEGREALAAEVVETIVREVSGPLLANLGSRRPAVEVIPRHFEQVAELVATRVSPRFMADVHAELPEASRLIRENRRRVVAGLVKVIKRGQREGSIDPGHRPETIGKIVNAILENSVSPAFALSEDLGLAEIGETLSLLFLRGLFVAGAVPVSGRGRRRAVKRSGGRK